MPAPERGREEGIQQTERVGTSDTQVRGREGGREEGRKEGREEGRERRRERADQRGLRHASSSMIIRAISAL